MMLDGENRPWYKIFINWIAGTIATRVFTAIVFATVASALLYGRAYMRYYGQRGVEHVAHNVFYETICTNDTLARMSMQTQKCEIVKLEKDWSPSILAFFDVVEDLGPCGKEGCSFYLKEWTNGFWTKFLTLVVISFCLTMAVWGFFIKQRRKYDQLYKYRIPTSRAETHIISKDTDSYKKID